jgi:hypothetical protein
MERLEGGSVNRSIPLNPSRAATIIAASIPALLLWFSTHSALWLVWLILLIAAACIISVLELSSTIYNRVIRTLDTFFRGEVHEALVVDRYVGKRRFLLFKATHLENEQTGIEMRLDLSQVRTVIHPSGTSHIAISNETSKMGEQIRAEARKEFAVT